VSSPSNDKDAEARADECCSEKKEIDRMKKQKVRTECKCENKTFPDPVAPSTSRLADKDFVAEEDIFKGIGDPAEAESGDAMEDEDLDEEGDEIKGMDDDDRN
jgi:hypothetical protein